MIHQGIIMRYAGFFISAIICFYAQANSIEKPFDLWGEPQATDVKTIQKEMEEKAIRDYKVLSKNPYEFINRALSDLRQSALACFDEFNDGYDNTTLFFKEYFVKGIQDADAKIHHQERPTIVLKAGQGKVDKLPEDDTSRKTFLAALQLVAQELRMCGTIYVQVTDKIYHTPDTTWQTNNTVSIMYKKPSRCSDIALYIDPKYESLFLTGDVVARGVIFHELSHVLFGSPQQVYEMLKDYWMSRDQQKAIPLLKKMNHAQELFADLYALNKSEYAGNALLAAIQETFAAKASFTHPSGTLRFKNICYFNTLCKQHVLWYQKIPKNIVSQLVSALRNKAEPHVPNDTNITD